MRHHQELFSWAWLGGAMPESGLEGTLSRHVCIYIGPHQARLGRVSRRLNQTIYCHHVCRI